MSKSNSYETSILALLFNATAIADIAENDTTSPITSLHVSAHTADPLDAGNQQTSEATYSPYARQPVLRTSGGWTVSGASVSPVANIDFPACVTGSETITHGMIGSILSGAGVQYYRGAVTPSIVVSAGVTPRFTTASTITED